jgi:hypothetical protein
MNHGWMLVIGCAIVGWIFVEWIGCFGQRHIPVSLNVLGAIAGALIAGAFV